MNEFGVISEILSTYQDRPGLKQIISAFAKLKAPETKWFTFERTNLLEVQKLLKNIDTKKAIGFRSSRPEVFLRIGVLKICRKFTKDHPCRSVISVTLLCNFIEIAFRHGCSPVNLLHIFRTHILTLRKSARILSYFGPHFRTRIRSECGKMRTRITPNTDPFHVVLIILLDGCFWGFENITQIS